MDWKVFDFAVSHSGELVVFAGGSALFVWFLVSYRKARQANRWPMTTGRILGSRVAEKKGGEKTYKPEIIYQYQVDGKDYIGDVRRFGAEANSGSKRDAEQVVRRYAAGRMVTVAFNPQKPAEAVLEPGEAEWWPALAGLVCAAVGLASLLEIPQPLDIVFVCTGLGVLGSGIASYRRVQKARDWPMTSATVVSSRIVQDGRIFKKIHARDSLRIPGGRQFLCRGCLDLR